VQLQPQNHETRNQEGRPHAASLCQAVIPQNLKPCVKSLDCVKSLLNPQLYTLIPKTPRLKKHIQTLKLKTRIQSLKLKTHTLKRQTLHPGRRRGCKSAFLGTPPQHLTGVFLCYLKPMSMLIYNNFTCTIAQPSETNLNCTRNRLNCTRNNTN